MSEGSSRQAVEAEAGGQPQPEEPDEATEPQGPARDLDAELAEIEARYKRALADLDNYRKRSAGEIERQVFERTDQIIRDWLEVMDSIERALRMAEPTSPTAAGLGALLEQMEAILDRQGVARTGAVGEPFDPGVHEAVGVRETDEVPGGTIVDVARSGFNRGDRVLRPAQVVVSRRGGGGEG